MEYERTLRFNDAKETGDMTRTLAVTTTTTTKRLMMETTLGNNGLPRRQKAQLSSIMAEVVA